MTIASIHTAAATIISRAAFASLDFGQSQIVSGNVQCAYEVWLSDFRRTGPDTSAKDEFAYSVRKAIESLGFSW